MERISEFYAFVLETGKPDNICRGICKEVKKKAFYLRKLEKEEKKKNKST